MLRPHSPIVRVERSGILSEACSETAAPSERRHIARYRMAGSRFWAPLLRLSRSRSGPDMTTEVDAAKRSLVSLASHWPSQEKLKTADTAEKRRTQSAAGRGAAEGGRQQERQREGGRNNRHSNFPRFASRGACSICTVAGSLYPPLKQPQLTAQSWVGSRGPSAAACIHSGPDLSKTAFLCAPRGCKQQRPRFVA